MAQYGHIKDSRPDRLKTRRNTSHMGFARKYLTQNDTKKHENHKNFRVKTTVKSFRDLDVYKKTTELSAEIFTIVLPRTIINKKLLEEEFHILRTLSKQVPRLIAESYGDRFTDKSVGDVKIEKAMRTISDVVTKLDFLVALFADGEIKTTLVQLVGKYQIQRRKINNLKNAWNGKKRSWKKPFKKPSQ